MEETNEEAVSEEEVVDSEVEETTDAEETVDWEAEAKKLQGRLKRAETKLKKETTEVPKPTTKEIEKSGEIDDGQLALLVAKGIEEPAEIALFKEYKEAKGKTTLETLNDKYFKQDLEELRTEAKNVEATPKGSKRSTTSAKDSVDYWLNKPFKEVPADMKRKVLAAKEAKAKDTGKMSEGPSVISNFNM